MPKPRIVPAADPVPAPRPLQIKLNSISQNLASPSPDVGPPRGVSINLRSDSPASPEEMDAQGSWKHVNVFNMMSEDDAARLLQKVIRGYIARKRLNKKKSNVVTSFCLVFDTVVPVILPTSTFRLYWDFVSMLFILYQFLVVPYYLAWLPPPLISFAFDSIVDLFFLLDIGLNFRTGVVTGAEDDEMNMVSTDGYLIAKYYLKSWFLVDLLATMPGVVDFVLGVGNGGETPDGGAKVLKILRCFKIFKLLRVMKNSDNIHAIFEQLEDHLHVSVKYKRMFAMLFSLFFLTHVIACSWFGVSKLSHQKHKAGWYHSELEDGSHYNEDDHKEQYIWSVYWAITTISTVGYGDISPATLDECIFTIVAMCVGVGTFGYLLGIISEISATDSAAVRMHDRMQSINGYLNEKKVPKELKRKIRNFFKYMMTHKSMYDEQSILEELSLKLRVELTTWINKDMIARVPLLQHLDSGCVNLIVEHLNPDNFDKGETIFKEGDAGREMFFICNGAVELNIQVATTGNHNHDFKKVRRLMMGDHFGELCLLPSYQKHDSVVASKLEKRRKKHPASWPGQGKGHGPGAKGGGHRSPGGGGGSGKQGSADGEGGRGEEEEEEEEEDATPSRSISARRLASAVCYTVVDVYSLRKEHLDVVFQEFPEFAAKLEHEARYRKQAIDKVRKYWTKMLLKEGAAAMHQLQTGDGSLLKSKSVRDYGDPNAQRKAPTAPQVVKDLEDEKQLMNGFGAFKSHRKIDFSHSIGSKRHHPRQTSLGNPTLDSGLSTAQAVTNMDVRMAVVEDDVRQIKALLQNIAAKVGADPNTGVRRHSAAETQRDTRVSFAMAPSGGTLAPAATATSANTLGAILLPTLPPKLDEDMLQL